MKRASRYLILVPPTRLERVTGFVPEMLADSVVGELESYFQESLCGSSRFFVVLCVTYLFWILNSGFWIPCFGCGAAALSPL